MKNKNGFTLIELMIVVAIVGILAGIAVPGYNSYITKARRSDATITLLNDASKMERYYTEENTYADSLSDIGSGNVSKEGYYDLSLDNISASTYTIIAKPVTGKGQEKDSACLCFSINQFGEKKASKDAGGCVATSVSNAKQVKRCW